MEDLYHLLNVPRSADDETIRAAINRELRVWSQRTNAAEIEKRQAAERKVKLLEEAETTLLDSAKRAKYSCELDRQPKPVDNPESSSGDLGDSVQAMIEKAIGLVRIGHHPGAISLLSKAVRLDPGNSRLQAMLSEIKKEWGQILIKNNF
jgi:curved DNA-binding protein CbpA